MPTETVPLRNPNDSHDGTAPLRRFGPYEITRKLGRSMTDVYLARDTRNEGRLTVLKIVEESNDPYTQQVLVAERRGAAIQKQLREFDPRFVEIYEYGQLENAFYVAMEYVEGSSVADIIRDGGRIDPQAAARIAMEICSQLEKLHSHQAEIDGRRRAIVHGDIKPSNVQINSNGQVRLLDFGIAKVISLTRNLTHHDLGSPNYCSPERLASTRVDQHADLWATGVSLYEMVSGTLPFQAESTRKLENVIRSKRPPRPIPQDCPERLAIIIRKSLTSDIKRRYPTASAFAADLECFLNGRPTIAECELKGAETNPTVESVRVFENTPDAPSAKHSKDILWQTLLRVRVPKRVGRRGVVWAIAVSGVAVIMATAGYIYHQRWTEAAPLRDHTNLARLNDLEIAADWDLLQNLQTRDAWLGPLSPAKIAAHRVEAAYVAEGDRIIASYRTSPRPGTTDYDWPRAQTLLEHAQELDPANPEIHGKLALAKGYVYLNLASGAQMSVRQQMEDRVTHSWQEFDQAVSLLPNAPDPHLGLARLYVYSYRNLDKAIEEWNKAEQRKYKLGPREIEQEADGFRIRAEKELTDPRDHAAAQEDLAHAKELYKSIHDYEGIAQRLQFAAQVELALNPPPPPPAPVKTAANTVAKTPVKKAAAKIRAPTKEDTSLAVTKSWEATEELTTSITTGERRAKRERLRLPGLIWLLLASLIVAGGLGVVYSAKIYRQHEPGTPQTPALNLNTVTSPEQIVPYLQFFPSEQQRDEVAKALFTYLQQHRPLPNIGALAKMWRGLQAAHVTLSRLKPLWTVRTETEFRRDFLQFTGLYFASFWLVYFAWRIRKFNCDPTILPAVHILSGLGLILMVSLRDPLRDTEEFAKFSKGVAVGAIFLILPLIPAFDYRRLARMTYLPLLTAFALFVGLLRFGTGPGGSDARVNLGPFQPVEFIKILLVLFLASYFANKWERLRDLREKRFLRFLNLPRIEHAAPVFVTVSIGLALFFVLKDLGPALVTGFLFLTLFALARGRAGLALLGIATLIGGVAIGYRMGQPHTVVDRISMWLGPWDNNIHGGNQLAHGLWALATGGPFGSGPGYGDPSMIPAGDTDLVLPSIGEEWGYVGVATVGLLFAFLAARGLRAALRARSEYGFFLAAGLTTLLMLEMLLISGGVLGAVPLSGVVSPFLSSGNSAMLANFIILALILAVSANPSPDPKSGEPFRIPVRVLECALALCCAALLWKAADYQIFHDRDYLARDTHVFEDDGVKRAQHNPRLNSLAHEIQRGNILDRNGALLATSNWSEIEKLNLPSNQNVARLDGRYYPYGAQTVQLLGDWRTGEDFHATNTSFIERDSNNKLQGYTNLSELAPLIRYRHAPGNADIEHLRNRDRNVRTSLDIRLQLAASDILQQHLRKAHLEHGAVVMMDVQTGGVLAMVNAPEPAFVAPAQSPNHSTDELLDRARYGTYPPGSTFKIVTAMAALRLDPANAKQTYSCRRLPDGRVGALIPGWNRPIHDDDKDHAHGSLQMRRAIIVSCNGYFAQLGVYRVGTKALAETARLLEISTGPEKDLKRFLPFAAYGQGEVLVTPFKMARIAATIANDGVMPQGRWVDDGSDARNVPGRRVLDSESAKFIADAMRGVVLEGTARSAMQGIDFPVTGKTGTAQLDAGEPHSWFIGYAAAGPAPLNQPRIAFAVLVEHGGYGGSMAAPIAHDLLLAADKLGILKPQPIKHEPLKY